MHLDIETHNASGLSGHEKRFQFLADQLKDAGVDANAVVDRLSAFQVAIPTWALGAGGTRFARFPGSGEPRNLEEKIADVGLIHALTRNAGAISLHIPWDIPEDAQAIRELAAGHDLRFDAVNSNTFQDQADQEHSYKFGSLCHMSASVREQAIDHNIAVIEYGKALGSKSLTVWLADGACFPGQHNFRKALFNTRDSLQQIYAQLPEDWRLFLEYKPYEPNFYATVIQDWGTSYLLAQSCGERAYCLVDLGHHLPNTNIEQIVATLISAGRLGGLHFNDSKFGDDDLTVGSIKPYQLFLILHELVWGMANNRADNPPISYMIDASHNLKDPLEDLMQSLEAILEAYARALIIDHAALDAVQMENDVLAAEGIMQAAFRTDVRPLLRESRVRAGGALDPIGVYRDSVVRYQLMEERGDKTIATGL